MADAISVGDGKYLYYVNDSIQGMGGKPFAHKPGKKLVCTTEDLTLLLRNNGCLCNYQAVKVYRTFCYLQSLSVLVYKLGMCPRGIDVLTYSALGLPTQKKRAMVWKWCGWYEYVGCQGYPGGGGWTDPDIGTSLNKASKRQLTLCTPQYVGNKEYTHSVQQRLVTSYLCCTTLSGLQGCCRLVDSDSLGLKRCVTAWTISRLSPTAPWGSWQFLKKIGCVGQNKYLADKASLTTRIDVASCTSARGYSLTLCGTCEDDLLYTQFPPNGKPLFLCRYWVLYLASYVLTLQYCGWGLWVEWDWSQQPGPDQSIVKGTNGWAPLSTAVCKTSDGRKAGVHLYLCKTKRVWHWKTFLRLSQKDSFDPSNIRKADKLKCKPCTLHKFKAADHTLRKPGDRLLLGLNGAPCMLPLLPRAVIKLDNSCYDLYLYLLLLEGTDKKNSDNKLGCIKRLSYKKLFGLSLLKDYLQIALGVTEWLLLNTKYNNVLVIDNLGRTIKRDDGSWYFLRAIPCGEDPLLWDLDGAANLLPQDKQQVDTCIRAFIAGVYCVSDSLAPIKLNDLIVGYLKKPYVTSGECGKWKKLGSFTLLLVALSAVSASYKYDLTKTNKWQIPRWKEPNLKFLMVYIKTSTTRDVICDKLPQPPKNVYYRAKVIKLQLKCSDSSNNWDGIAKVRWPQQALCVSDAMLYCSSVAPVNMTFYKDKKLKQPILKDLDYYIVSGCEAYMCILLQAQQIPFTLLAACSPVYLRTQGMLLLVAKLVFDNCVLYTKYSLWQTTQPCADLPLQDLLDDDLADLFDLPLDDEQKPSRTVWSIVPKLNTSPPLQIAACACDLDWALQLIRGWLLLYTEGLLSLLANKLLANKTIAIKKLDGTYVWYYLQATHILKPLLWLDLHGDLLTLLLIAYLYMHNPCQFAQDLQLPDVEAHGVYGLTLIHLVALCRVQSDSKIAGYAGVNILTKYDLQGDDCQTGSFLYCKPDLPKEGNYFLDRLCTTMCPHKLVGDLAVLTPPSDATDLWYLAHIVTLLYALGLQVPLPSCLLVTLDDIEAALAPRVLWGGNNVLALQLSLNCCPRYLFKYQYVVRVASNPCLTQGAATILLAQDNTKTGWLSYLPVTQDQRLWEDFDPKRTLIIGLPTCLPVSTLCLWLYPNCSSGAAELVFSLLIVLGTPTISSTKLPWQLLSPQRCGAPSLSNYSIKLTGFLSYIVGTGAVFLWDVNEASIACDGLLSAWDNTLCDELGHAFTYYANSPMTYGQCTGEGTVLYTSPRSLFQNMTHPELPLAKWSMSRQYSLDRTTYSDIWCDALDAEVYCGDALCLWSGLQCGTTWTLTYTQALNAALPPADSPLACWNKNAPSFSSCFAYKYTRKYVVQSSITANGVNYCSTYLNAGDLTANWLLIQGALGIVLGWDSMLCALQHVYIVKGMLSADQRQQTPLQLFNVQSPAGPGYVKVHASGLWSYNDVSGVGALGINFTLPLLSCVLGEPHALCDNGSLTAYAYFSVTQCPTNSSVDKTSFLQAILGLYSYPWAKLVNTWSTANGWAGWSFDSLLCLLGLSTELNTVTCQDLKSTVTLLYYTQGGLTSAPSTDTIPKPNKVYKYTASKEGTINSSTGLFCFSNPGIQGLFVALKCPSDSMPAAPLCSVLLLFGFDATPTTKNNISVLQAIVRQVQYVGTYCNKSCTLHLWTLLTYRILCIRLPYSDTSGLTQGWNNLNNCCGTYKSSLYVISSLPDSGCLASMRPSPSKIPAAIAFKRYWYATYIWNPSSVSLASLVKTCLSSANTFSGTLSRDTTIAPAFDLGCDGAIEVGSIRGPSTIQACNKTSVQIYFTSTPCSTTSVTPSATETATITKSSSIQYKQIVYESGCQKSSGTYTYNGSDCINSSKIGTWSKVDSSVADKDATWRYYYGCNAPTTTPSLSGMHDTDSLTIGGRCLYPWRGVSHTWTDTINVHFLGDSSQKLSLKPIAKFVTSSYYFPHHPSLWGVTTCTFNLKFLDANNKILATRGGSISSKPGELYLLDGVSWYELYIWLPTLFSLSTTCGDVVKIEATLTFNTERSILCYYGQNPDGSYHIYCGYDLALMVNIVKNTTRSITNLSAYANALASLLR